METINTLIMGMKKASAPTETPKKISRVNYTIESSDVKLNYFALCVCVLSERIPEEAFRVMRITAEKIKAKDTDIDEILRLKKTLTWKQIGKIYGVSESAIWRRVDRQLKRQKIS